MRRIGTNASLSKLPPALRRDRLAVEPELVTPVLAVERPDDVLLVGLDDVGLGLLDRDRRSGDRLVELIALRGGDVDEDLRPVAQVLLEVLQVALVARAREVAGVAD